MKTEARTSGGDWVDAGTEVFNDSAGAALDRQNVGDFQDDILAGGPPVELAGQFHTDNLGAFELPRDISHDVDGVRATDTDA